MALKEFLKIFLFRIIFSEFWSFGIVIFGILELRDFYPSGFQHWRLYLSGLWIMAQTQIFPDKFWPEVVFTYAIFHSLNFFGFIFSTSIRFSCCQIHRFTSQWYPDKLSIPENVCSIPYRTTMSLSYLRKLITMSGHFKILLKTLISHNDRIKEKQICQNSCKYTLPHNY